MNNTPKQNPDCIAYRVLLSGLIDNELTEEELHAVQNHLYKCESCRAEYDRLLALGQKLSSKSFQEPSDADLEKLWRAPSYRLIQWSAFLLIGGGIGAIGFSRLWVAMAIEPQIIWFPVSISAIILGIVILLIQVLLERMIVYKKDPYKEVKR